MTSFGLIAGAGSAPHGASGARKRNVGWEARNKLNVAAPGPERRLIIIRCIELLDRDRSSRRLSPDAGLIAVGKFDTLPVRPGSRTGVSDNGPFIRSNGVVTLLKV
jgi:hypothetical protein